VGIAVVATTVAASAVLGAGTAFAAVPAFPDDTIVFPDRDFVSTDGYDGHQGETATVEVYRPGVGIVGAGPVVGTPVQVVAAAPGPGGTWSIRLRNKAAPAANPGSVWIASNNGGTAGPFTLG
jgi:hypothetical protein